MAKSAYKRRASAWFDPQACVAYLRRVHPTKTAQAVEAATTIPARTVERWLQLDAVPSVGAFVALVRAYGPAFVAACIPHLDWVDRAAAIAEHDGMMREIARLEARRHEVACQLLVPPERMR